MISTSSITILTQNGKTASDTAEDNVYKDIIAAHAAAAAAAEAAAANQAAEKQAAAVAAIIAAAALRKAINARVRPVAS
jgi:hypothetical protein